RCGLACEVTLEETKHELLLLARGAGYALRVRFVGVHCAPFESGEGRAVLALDAARAAQNPQTVSDGGSRIVAATRWELPAPAAAGPTGPGRPFCLQPVPQACPRSPALRGPRRSPPPWAQFPLGGG